MTAVTKSEETWLAQLPSRVRGGSMRQAPAVSYHLGLLMLCGGILLASFVLGVNAQNQTYLPPFSSYPMAEICPFKRATGHDCAGCGMTRSIVSISHGDWQRAWQFHRGGFALYFFLLGQLLYNGIMLWRVRRGQISSRWRTLEYSGIAVVVFLIGNWVWNLWLA